MQGDQTREVLRSVADRRSGRFSGRFLSGYALRAKPTYVCFIPDDWLHRLDHCTHEIVVETLPANHRDPFDRILVAQSLTETLRRMTHDATVACDRDTIVLI